MNKIKAAIIEDEIPAARLLNKMLTELRPEWEIQVLPGNVEGAVKWYQDNPHPDILFLDIQLTDGVSFSFIEQANPESMIVFTTAYDEYAIRAFKANSIDYLLKPIDKERLGEALEKYEKLTSKFYKEFNKQGDILEILQNITNPAKKYRTRFLISGEDKLFTLQVDLSLDKLCEQLDPDRFFRTNRQTIVSVQAIQKIESYFLGKVVVKVIPPFKDKIIVSREKISAFKLWLNY